MFNVHAFYHKDVILSNDETGLHFPKYTEKAHREILGFPVDISAYVVKGGSPCFCPEAYAEKQENGSPLCTPTTY